jgi:hypothetical protein
VLAGVLLFAPGAEGPAIASAIASSIADHRALYDITLERARPGSTVQGVAGQMILEVKGQCETVTVNQMFRSDFWGADSKSKHSELRISSAEARDGASFAFSFHNVVDGVIAEHFEGKAARVAIAAEGAITYEASAFPKAPLPDDAIFPTGHLTRLLAAAEGRERSLTVKVFDGAEKGKVYRAVALIGRTENSAADVPASLSGLAHWRVMISYYPLGTAEPAPEYESAFDLYANGVSAGIVLDYGEFAIRADLQSLKLLPKPECE